MARKKLDHTPNPADDGFDPEKLEAAGQATMQIGEMQRNYGQGRDLVNQLLGQAQAFKAAGNLLQTFGVSKLAIVKEHKLYQQLAGSKTPNGLEFKGTWTEFCALLGMSDEKANQDIANLQAFGEEALEQMQRVGIGYRDLRQFRKLPADQRTALIEAAKEGDKATLLELAEDLIAKHSKEKDSLTSALDDAKVNLKAKDKVIEKKSTAIDKLTETLEKRKLKDPTPDTEAAELVSVAHSAEATACAWIEGHLRQAIDAVMAHDQAHGSNHAAVMSGFIARIEDATDALRLMFALPRLKTGMDDPFEVMPDDLMEQISRKTGIPVPTPINAKGV